MLRVMGFHLLFFARHVYLCCKQLSKWFQIFSNSSKKLVLGLMIRDRTGHVIWGTNTWHTHQVIDQVRAGERIVFTFEFECALGPDSYSVSPALVSSNTHLEDNYEWTDNLFVFDVINTDKDFFIGTTLLDGAFTIQRAQVQ